MEQSKATCYLFFNYLMERYEKELFFSVIPQIGWDIEAEEKCFFTVTHISASKKVVNGEMVYLPIILCKIQGEADNPKEIKARAALESAGWGQIAPSRFLA